MQLILETLRYVDIWWLLKAEYTDKWVLNCVTLEANRDVFVFTNTKNGQMIVFYLSYQYEHEGIDNMDWLTMVVSIHMTMQYIVVINLSHMISGPACHGLYSTFAVLRCIRGAVCRFHIGVTLLSLYPPYPKDRGMLWFYVEAARRPPPATRRPQWC